MPTAWTFPSNIVQYTDSGAEELDITWDDSNNFAELKNLDERSLQSNGTLIHIARAPKHDIRNKTYYLQCTGFNFVGLPNIITGIEVKLTSRRYGRAQDDVIQLCLNGSLVGDNLSTPLIDPIKIYGGSSNLWGTELTRLDLLNSTFGFTFRFQSHRNWPHKDPVLVDAVEIRIY